MPAGLSGAVCPQSHQMALPEQLRVPAPARPAPPRTWARQRPAAPQRSPPETAGETPAHRSMPPEAFRRLIINNNDNK